MPLLVARGRSDRTVLGLAALVALGITGAIAAAGIAAVVIAKGSDPAASGAIVALASIASTAIGAIAGQAFTRHDADGRPGGDRGLSDTPPDDPPVVPRGTK